MAKKLGITKELAQQVISNRQANAPTLNKPLTQDELFQKALDRADPNYVPPTNKTDKEQKAGPSVMLTPEEEQPELNLLPREDNESEVNELSRS